ncbi:hypothetical protein BCR44DRAFT_1436101 [Catenaria anguillulae PL171]|uniref:Secreted protein n=1 Tax=Catenaria anguillulae PL171 TaxID=765915 RepID=A0A1Y2HJ68_9FUNG|nr:hypothetical protein BCR44DRAFT_1436101 [Catenaria anguillulae PL171]
MKLRTLNWWIRFTTVWVDWVIHGNIVCSCSDMPAASNVAVYTWKTCIDSPHAGHTVECWIISTGMYHEHPTTFPHIAILLWVKHLNWKSLLKADEHINHGRHALSKTLCRWLLWSRNEGKDGSKVLLDSYLRW